MSALLKSSIAPMVEAHLSGLHDKQMVFECNLCGQKAKISQRVAPIEIVSETTLEELQEVLSCLEDPDNLFVREAYNRLLAVVERLEG